MAHFGIAYKFPWSQRCAWSRLQETLSSGNQSLSNCSFFPGNLQAAGRFYPGLRRGRNVKNNCDCNFIRIGAEQEPPPCVLSEFCGSACWGLTALADANVTERAALRSAGDVLAQSMQVKLESWPCIWQGMGGSKVTKNKMEPAGSLVFLILLLEKQLVSIEVLKEFYILLSLKTLMLVTWLWAVLEGQLCKHFL